jgi:hypothetical protein
LKDVIIHKSVLEKFKELAKLVNLTEAVPIGLASVGLIVILTFSMIKYYCCIRKVILKI